jgi:hypothetical protein
LADTTPWPGALPFAQPLDAEQVPEFHAARLLLLLLAYRSLRHAAVRGRTKLVKLDFFMRYPKFLERALQKLPAVAAADKGYSSGKEGVEANMVRYRYGPWDPQYFNLIAFLLSRGLINVGQGTVETYSLTDAGRNVATAIAARPEFEPLIRRAELVSRTLGPLNGMTLKNFIYESFEDEVTHLPTGRTIRQDEQL